MNGNLVLTRSIVLAAVILGGGLGPGGAKATSFDQRIPEDFAMTT